MAKERNVTVLFLVGFVWLLIAGVWGYTLYNQLLHLPNLLTYGLSALVAGMFIGRGMQKMRMRKESLIKSPVEE